MKFCLLIKKVLDNPPIIRYSRHDNLFVMIGQTTITLIKIRLEKIIQLEEEHGKYYQRH